ncbi:MAG: helix-turn-helix transcriptional regulator [Synergistaceae bacterium]|nr:helix-turn-helix transcriptional regulator [Synergistaceae bacterium]
MFSFERLKSLRRERRYSQKALGDMVGVQNNTVWRWENGGATPDANNVSKLATALGSTVSYLMGETDDPAPPATDQPVSNKSILSSDPPATSGRLIYEQGDHRLDLPDTPENRTLFREIVAEMMAGRAVPVSLPASAGERIA